MAWTPKSAEEIIRKWNKHVSTRFDHFFAALNQRPVTIPDRYLEENFIAENGKLYRNFLRLRA